MNFTTQKSLAPRLLNAAFTLAALVVSTGASRAQEPAAAPAAKPVEKITPLQWLKRQPQPIYKPGHTMPRLTYYGYYRGLNGYIQEITANWNYTLLFP